MPKSAINSKSWWLLILNCCVFRQLCAIFTQDWGWHSSCFFTYCISVPAGGCSSSAMAERGCDPWGSIPSHTQVSWDEVHSQVGSVVLQLPHCRLSSVAGFRRLCWKVWWCFKSFDRVRKAEAAVGLVTVMDGCARMLVYCLALWLWHLNKLQFQWRNSVNTCL